MRSEIQSLKEQLLYLVDELDAQRPLYRKVSDSILGERPPGDVSIRDHYEHMLQAEEKFFRHIIKRSSDEVAEKLASEEATSIDTLLVRIMNARARNVQNLPADDSDLWEESITVNERSCSLLEWTYQVALGDAKTLRAITMQLSEIRMLFRQ